MILLVPPLWWSCDHIQERKQHCPLIPCAAISWKNVMRLTQEYAIRSTPNTVILTAFLGSYQKVSHDFGSCVEWERVGRDCFSSTVWGSSLKWHRQTPQMRLGNWDWSQLYSSWGKKWRTDSIVLLIPILFGFLLVPLAYWLLQNNVLVAWASSFLTEQWEDLADSS